MEKTTNLVKRDLQLVYCKEHKFPMFAPNDGKCYNCHRDIYKKITNKEAENTLITGCPYCKFSFVD